jgi:CrcB protein
MTPLFRSIAAVFVGGLVGTSARLALDVAIPHGDSEFPLSTLLINIVGSLALGMLVAGVGPTAKGWVRAGLGPGVLGSFTTFSAVMVSLISLTASDRLPIALVYLALSVVLGFAAALLGLQLGRGIARRRASAAGASGAGTSGAGEGGAGAGTDPDKSPVHR